jgi:hypothetical protein
MASMSFSSVPRRAPTAETSSGVPVRSGWGSRENTAPSRSGWGSGGGRPEFDSAAAAAFGKKPARIETPPSERPSEPTVRVTPARNTLASVLDTLLPDDPPPKQKQWAKSALQQQREAAKAEAAKKAIPPPKTYEEQFPALGGAGASSTKIPKPVISATPESKKTESVSFATLAASWAKADEERKYIEELEAKKRMEQQSLQEFENANRVRFHRNLNSNRMYADDGYYEDDYGEGDFTEDNYYDDGLGEEQQSLSAVEKRAMARRYEYEQGYDDDEHSEDYD